MKLSTNSLVMVIVASLIVLVAAGHTHARPTFRIGEGGDPWDNSPAGSISPASAADAQEALSDLFSQQDPGPDSVQGRQATLNFDLANVTDPNGISHDAMGMSWQPNDNLASDPSGMHLSVAGFDFQYSQDPDLTGTMIHFSLLPPDGIWDFALILKDTAGRKRKWMDFGAPNVWGDQWLDPSIAGPQGGFTFFTEDAGFDLTMVANICLYEAGTTVTATNPDGSVPAGFNWNAWNHLEVSPEPSSVMLFGLGSLVLVLVRRRIRN